MGNRLISPELFTLKRFAILTVLLSIVAVWVNPAGAQEQVKHQVKQRIARSEIMIAEELYDRARYKDSELKLLLVRDQYVEYLTAEDEKQLDEVLAATRAALSERARIVELLRESDQKAENQQYLEAVTLLEVIRNNKYLSDEERNQVVSFIEELEGKIAARREQGKGLFDESLSLYRLGKLQEARLGFEEVILSGMSVTSSEGKTALDYINLIDNALARSRLEAALPVARPGVNIEDEFFPIEPIPPVRVTEIRCAPLAIA